MFGRRSEEAEATAQVGCLGVSRRAVPQGGGSLIWWLVWIQKLFRESVDLVGPSDFVRQ